ncbi:uncharacterized protein [Epargyreus clarus]|uniref:uncharacterized protein n=1 Tax=Epargyreus clarus TaxID=520877 RepID=UPI003C2ED1B5
MNAYLALAIALAAPALAASAPRDRLGYEREIDATRYYPVPRPVDYVLNLDYGQKSKAKLVTKLRPDEAVAADNIILESNMVKIVKPAKKREDADEELVRTRRGYNLENVIVPARYPYLPVVRYNRFRRWG